MIAQTFDEVFSPQWVNTHLSHPTHDLIILRQLIPWQPIIDGLVPFYNLKTGRTGCALRTLVAVSILARLRQLSDRQVIEQIQENRYMQYFCNVPDQGLRTFMHPSTLCRFRKRVGQEGISLNEDSPKQASGYQKEMHSDEKPRFLKLFPLSGNPIASYGESVRLNILT
jgi:hypothetical protein